MPVRPVVGALHFADVAHVPVHVKPHGLDIAKTADAVLARQGGADPGEDPAGHLEPCLHYQYIKQLVVAAVVSE